MFKEIANLMAERDVVSLTLAKVNGKLTVSVIPTKTGLKDEAKNNLSPIVLTGTPEELDLEFINIVAQPIQKAAGILTNMETFEKSVEETQEKSKAITEAKKREDAEKKAFSEKFKKVETLFSEKKFADAAILLKQVSEMSGADKKQCENLKIKIENELNNGTLWQ